MDRITHQPTAVAIVGAGAVLPDAPDAPSFWRNLLDRRSALRPVPAGRWDPARYYHPDPAAPDKTYSTIGGWVTGFTFDWKRFKIPPRVADAMDDGQQWAVAAAAEALADYGYPQRSLDTERVGVIVGAAMGGDRHLMTHTRLAFPEFAAELEQADSFRQLPDDLRAAILAQWQARVGDRFPPITEDTMPGELADIISGRIANVLNLCGPNFTTDAACASSLAAVSAAVEHLEAGHCDAVLAGGVDRNMAASVFVKFCKIGALSGQGSRPFGAGADGFVMGEGGALFLFKRLADAERDGDRIYAVIRGIGSSSDGRGKGITAPNPAGQKLAIERAWRAAGLDPASASLIEAHGTSTKVGDVVEFESLVEIFSRAGEDAAAPRPGSIGLGSAKGNIGHLKAAAGAAGLLKLAFALRDKVLPPTLNADPPNPGIDLARSPFYLLNQRRDWAAPGRWPRRAGLSSYGFGGTNFHVVIEEHVPGWWASVAARPQGWPADRRPTTSGPMEQTALLADQGPRGASMSSDRTATSPTSALDRPDPLRGIYAAGAPDRAALARQVSADAGRAASGWAPPRAMPAPATLAQPERLVVDFGDAADLAGKLAKAVKLLDSEAPAAWRALQAQGVFRASGALAGKVAFLFPGQGSQYLNMGRELAAAAPLVKAVFDDGDRVMRPILGRPLTSYIFVDAADPAAQAAAEKALMDTAITQPAVLTMDRALHELLGAYGLRPDLVMGHSLGEYGALVAAGVLPFAHALEAVAARGREMARVSVADNGWMAAVFAPYEEIQKVLAEASGYVVAANINSSSQCVIGGESAAVEAAMATFAARGFKAVRIPVSHAFHTRIVAPAAGPLRQVLDRLDVRSPRLPLVANVTGQLYPTDPIAIRDLLEQQIASPVQWVQGLTTLYAQGVRVFVEVGPKKALKGFTDDLFDNDPSVWSLATNHPKSGELASFNQALCGLLAAGAGQRREQQAQLVDALPLAGERQPARMPAANHPPQTMAAPASPAPGPAPVSAADPGLTQLAQALQQALAMAAASGQAGVSGVAPGAAPRPWDRHSPPAGSIVVSGVGLGLPGAEKRLMDPDNALRLLRGEQFIDLVPERYRKSIVGKRITRLVKDADGNGRFEELAEADVIKLAGRPGAFDLEAEYGVPAKLVEALDITTQMAIAAGLDALREAGIPLVQTWRPTTTGKHLPDRWLLPEPLRDETGVIFASAFPGYEWFATELERYFSWEGKRRLKAELEELRRTASDPLALADIERRVAAVEDELAAGYQFDRRFLFRVLAMGHSQLAEYIGARGPNTQVNIACASTDQAIALAHDWIATGRCRRVLVVAADNVTGEKLFPWIGSGFQAVGGAATDDRIEDAALPFDRRRHGLIMGMGCCAFVLEGQDAVAERGMRGLVEVLACEFANSAFHATRLDTEHISAVMERLLGSAERRFGLDRMAIAGQTVFISHETYTPARGGSAAAEVTALRKAFGRAAGRIVISNTKGVTGHPMSVGIETALAVKMLEHGLVPPVPNLKEPDPDLGPLNLSRGGHYPVRYALRLAAGFGSQVAMSLLRRVPGGLDRVDDRLRYQRWLSDISGQDRAAVEVVRRVLRVAADGLPARPPQPSAWQPGIGPSQRAPVYGDTPPLHEGWHGQVNAQVRQAFLSAPAAHMEQGHGGQVRSPQTATGTAPLEHAVDRSPTLPLLGGWPLPQGQSSTPMIAVSDRPARDGSAGMTAPHSLTAGPVAALSGQPAPAASTPDTQGGLLPTPAGYSAVEQAVLKVVADKTGYPQDMLDLDLDLEADLGVDTVKQAETFATIRETFNIPKQQDLKLRDYPTLRAVVGFVLQHRPDLAANAAGPHAGDQAHGPTASDSPAPAAPQHGPGVAALPGAQAVEQAVLKVVADKTGYPQDMLELDLDLEADLGVDTVKQAETFATIRETFKIPKQQDLKLRDYPTLRAVVGFVLQHRPDLAANAAGSHAGDQAKRLPASDSPAAAAPQQATGGAALPDSGSDQSERAPRRVVVPCLRPPLTACKPTGIALAGSRVVVMPDEGGVGSALAKRLKKLGATPLLLDRPATDELATAEGRATWLQRLGEQLGAWQADGPLAGVYWLAALDVEPDLAALDLAAWRAGLALRVKGLYATMRTLYGNDQRETFLVAATRMGGLHGYEPDGALAPMGGAVTGFSKAYKRERPAATVKALDLGATHKPAAVAELLIAETLADPGVIEVGYHGGSRWSMTLAEQPLSVAPRAPGSDPGQRGEQLAAAAARLDQDSVVVVTGAAGGITSAIVADLAAHTRATFYLLDLQPRPAADDAEVSLLRRDREALKTHLIQAARERGDKPTPKLIDAQLLAVERRAMALAAIEAVQAAGGVAHYAALDLRDGAAVAAALAELRARHRRVDVLLHAAGLEISRDLPDKDLGQFELVFDVKADGLFNVLRALDGLPLGAVVGFSSVAGRFGNRGQTDYAAANDLLCKQLSALRRSGTRGIALDWTAWGGIGMATRGSIPAIMKAAGIDLLPPEVGVPTVRRELFSGCSGELVVGLGLGVLTDELDGSGGLADATTPEGAAALSTWLDVDAAAPLLGRVRACGLYSGLEVETTLDVSQPFLADHEVEPNLPFLPGVMGLESMARLAAALAPGLAVAAVEDLRFSAPVKFYRREPRTLWLSGLPVRQPDGGVCVHCELRSVTQPPKPDMPVRVATHFTCRVLLAPAAALPEARPLAEAATLPDGTLTVRRQQLYQTYFHGPAYQVLELAHVGGDQARGRLAAGLPGNCRPERPERALPRLVELFFQTAGLWAMRARGALELPAGIERLQFHPPATAWSGDQPGGTMVWAFVKARPERGFDGQLVDEQGRVIASLAGYQTVEIGAVRPAWLAGGADGDQLAPAAQA